MTNESEYKYCLLISQYYHSRHMYIVKIKDDFIDTARKCAIELMKYKRSDVNRDINLGDLDEKYCATDLESRYNINDAGDIYFINCQYANRCMNEAQEYWEHSMRESRGYKNKALIDNINAHHDRYEIYKIVNKYFEIA